MVGERVLQSSPALCKALLGVCGRAEVFPSNLGFFRQSGDLFVFPKGRVSEGNPLLFACPW